MKTCALDEAQGPVGNIDTRFSLTAVALVAGKKGTLECGTRRMKPMMIMATTIGGG